ncbi:hypothetical protein [Flavobacterium sp. CF136]|uniref:hypothetical protein n=1 Tax=Flavobacterium sp. (strain CF136) TaxID=1144313 RepID=UPI0002719F1C|nr:hypothetical protein [Flavobacterium sp. CF136]EJL66314.1 hypothetical protein PMI10_00662 [Flavobacterium sp. CF136]
MANSKITIVFNDVPVDGNILNIAETTQSRYLSEVFKETRLASYQTQIPGFLPDDGIHPDRYIGFISNYYKSAFNLDHNIGSQFTITSINGPTDSGTGTVIIEANYPNAFFIVDINTADVDVTIENEEALPDFNIIDTSFDAATTNQCQNVKVIVETDELATKILSPISVNPNTDNPLSFDWLRGDTINLLLEDVNGTQVSQLIVLPSLLTASNFTINVNNSPNGATVTVENVNTSGLDLEYSLNNSTWQTENVFSGLDVGNFTLYVRDQFGCSFNKPFSVNEFGIQSPYFYISKANSIRYANRITWGDSENYKNDENTLSCEVDVELPYKEYQQFQSADIPATQFKSNYASNVATVIKEDLTEVNVPIVKKTNNIGIKDKRDARKYNLGDGKTGVYFLSGNTYDYDTDVVSGTYSLNGLLPEWAIVGNYIVISNAWFLIEQIVYDETKNADVIVFSQNYIGPEISVVAGSIFNRFNYEVYEYSIDMVNYIDQKFRVRLVNSDPNFTTITHLSEVIWSKVKHDNVLEIHYYNTTNTDVFYSTGIEFKIRIPYTIIRGKVDEDSEVHKTDTDTILLTADLYEGDEVVFEPVTKEIWRKIMIALSHERVWLNGVGYVKNGSFNTEGPLEKSNLYVLTANMLKTGNVYNSQGSGNLDFDGTEIEVPGLISTESGYVSY